VLGIILFSFFSFFKCEQEEAFFLAIRSIFFCPAQIKRNERKKGGRGREGV